MQEKFSAWPFTTLQQESLSAPITVDFGGVNTCLLPIRIKLTAHFLEGGSYQM